MTVFIIAQIFGIFGMTMNVVSYQSIKQKNIILLQLFGSLFFTVNMFLLNAEMGGLLNLIGFVRAVVYSNKDKIKNIGSCNAIFIFLYVLSYLSVFFVFQKQITFFNVVIEILPLIAMTATTIAFSKNSSASVRRLALISSPAWLIYNCINVSVGGILCETFSLVSILSAMVRIDMKRRSNDENTDAQRNMEISHRKR